MVVDEVSERLGPMVVRPDLLNQYLRCQEYRIDAIILIVKLTAPCIWDGGFDRQNTIPETRVVSTEIANIRNGVQPRTKNLVIQSELGADGTVLRMLQEFETLRYRPER